MSSIARHSALLGLDPGSICVHGGRPEPYESGSLVATPALAAAYHQDLKDVVPPRYARWGHESAERLESLLGALDGGSAVAFNSGMAALSATVFSLVKAGQRLVLGGDIYYETRQIAEQLAALGVEVAVLGDVEAELEEAVAGARLVVLESPSNPFMHIHDLRWCAEVVHEAGALLAVDNSVSSPLGQLPLKLGADLVVSSDAKVTSGHNDVVLGHVTTRDEELLSALRLWRHLHGSIASAFDCWLAQRSIGSLQLRVERQVANAAAVVELLAERPEVTRLRWPGWVKDPQYSLATEQMLNGGGVFAFQLPDREHLHRFLNASRLVVPSTSYGGLQSMANDIFAWPHVQVSPGYVRMSCGVETTSDLVDDVLQALDTAVSLS